MKKSIITIALAVLLTFVMLPVASFADVFVASPSTVPAQTLESAVSSNPDWNGEIILTPYSMRDTLPEDLQTTMGAAAASIIAASDVSELNSGLVAIAQQQGLKIADLAVSDLFDLRATFANYGRVTVKLSAESAKNFVALLHYKNSAWEIVNSASVSGTTLTFTSDDFSPFAIIVNTAAPDSPQTGEAFPWVLLAGAVVSGVFGVSILYIGRKKTIGA